MEITTDHLLGGRVCLRQPQTGYRVAIDAVLLAAATPAVPGQRILDLGTGVGAAALCLATRVADTTVIGLEFQPELATLARDNITANALDGRVRVIEGDLLAPPPELFRDRFDLVMANPPFLKAGAHTPAANRSRAAANGEGEATLADWIACAATLLRPRGTLTLIHRADRVDEVLARLHPRFGGVVLFPLWPRAGAVAAKRILVSARKDVRSPATFAAGLVLHNDGRGYSAQTEMILFGGESLQIRNQPLGRA
ncbi:tRNA1Val (adenine37-N6)-methyltransferase [uncultured Gammaproteobacteria bacterium]